MVERRKELDKRYQRKKKTVEAEGQAGQGWYPG